MTKIYYELFPVYDSRKSFYGKAHVLEENGKKTLISYDSKICTIENGKVTFEPYEWLYSVTTCRHVCEFLRQNGFNAMSKKEILKAIA